MKKVKVCHVTSVHQPKDGRIFAKECVSLAKSGYDVYLVEQGNDDVCQNVTIMGCGERPKSRFKRMTSFSRKVVEKALDVDADIYHLHDPELLPYAIKIKSKGKKVIFDSHENYPLQIRTKEYLPKPLRFLVSWLYTKFETFILNKIDAAIIPCSLNGKNIFFNRVKCSEYIDNYPLFSEFYDKYDEKVQKEGYVCYVGALTYERGIYHLVKAASLAGVSLVLAGKYSPEQFENIIRSLSEYSNVDYRGIITRNEVAKIDGRAVAGMCTLLDYGQYHKADNFSTKILEYMAMGLPVILFDYPYARKIMQEYKFGICVKPDDINEIARAIKFIISHPEEAYKMGQEGRRAVKEKFNWDTQEKKLLALYNKI